MVKLYKFNASPVARATIIGCELLNVPVEMIDVNLLEREQFSPEFAKINTLRRVPVLQDGDLTIHDSVPILMYLADAYGKQESYYPKDLKKRAEVNQKLVFCSTVLFQRLFRITRPIVVEKKKDIPQEYLDELEEAAGFTEEFLTKNKYLAGDNITIADIEAYVLVPIIGLFVDFNEKKYPKIHAWMKEMEKLPAVQKHNPEGAAFFNKMIEINRA